MIRRRRAALAIGLSLLVSGCASGTGSGALSALDALAAPTTPPPESSTTVAVAPEQRQCEEQGLATKSLRPTALPPSGQMPAGSWMEEIQRRGYLIAGVDQTTLGFGNRTQHGQLEGFDVSIVHEVAKAIFGDPGKVELLAVTSKQREPAVIGGTVDLVASLMTMNCDRWQHELFSSEYYLSEQRVLVSSDSPISSLGDLDGKKTCVTINSTSITNLARKLPAAIRVPVESRTDCLALLQEGQVDAITADATILYGFQKQDPNTKLLDGSLEDEPYGIAIAQAHPEFVRFVNAVLERLRADGTWGEMHDQLESELPGLPDALPPTPEYRD